MRSSKSRSRNKSNRQRPLGNVVNRVFDSSGPEGKVRGTPQQIIDKYLTLARDAQLSGDRVAEQSFLQHAEHYTRMLGDAMREQAERQQQQQGGQGQPRDDDGGRSDDRQQQDDRQQHGDRGARRDDDRPRDDRRRDDSRRDESRRDESRKDESRRENGHAGAAPDAGDPPWQGWAARDEGGLPDAIGAEDDAAGGAVELPEAKAQEPQAAPDEAAPAEPSGDAPAARRRTTRTTTRSRTPRAKPAAEAAPDPAAATE